MRPLVKRAPDGRRYAVLSTPRHPAPVPTPQPASDTASGPEPTPSRQRPNRRPKLTDDDVRAIRADYAESKWSQHDLAYLYGFTQATISAAVSGDTWWRVTEPTPTTGLMRWHEFKNA